MSFATMNIVVIGLAVATVLLAIDSILVRQKMRKICRSGKCSSIDDSIMSLDKDVKSLGHFQKESETYFRDVEKRLRRSVQGLHTVRFNAFKGTGVGGNQSFATALVNEDGDGVVMSSMYSRDRVSVFSKPISRFKSQYELSGEESEALEKARDSVRA